MARHERVQKQRQADSKEREREDSQHRPEVREDIERRWWPERD